MKTIITIFCTLATVAFFALAAYAYQHREPAPKTLAELVDRSNQKLVEHNMPSARKGKSEYRCPNPDCDMKAWEVFGVHDLGTFTPDDDKDTECPQCGAEGE